jgi:two-component system phosphate regulon sensor histidine kinase PhoR
MRHLRPRTLLWQLGLALMAVQAAIALALGAYAYARLRQFHEEQTVHQLHQGTAQAAARFAALAPSDAVAAQALATRIASETGLRVTLILRDGVVTADSEHDPATMDNHRYRPEVDRALAEGTGQSVRYSETLDVSMAYAARTMYQADDPVAVVRLALPLRVAAAELRHLIQIIGVASAICLVSTLLIFMLISRRLSGAVRGVARGAARFAAGDLEHRIARPSSDELATVAESLNRMAAELSARIERLQAQQNEEQAILDSMSSGVLALDSDQRLLRTNRAAERLLRLDGAAARGRLLQEVAREPGLDSFVARALSGAAQRHEFRIGHDRPRTVQAAAEPLRDAQGRTVGLLVILDDVTELRRLETIRSDFAANVSHELRTPITSIKGYLETVLESDRALGRETRRHLEVVGRNAERLGAIIEDLLTLARLEEPQRAQALERSDTSVQQIVDSALEEFRTPARDRNITLRARVEPGLRLRVNAPLLGRALANLLSNAVKFAPPGTAVIVGGRRRDADEVELAVTDEGPGIAAQHLPRLFERFYRVDRGRSRELGGTGLGLAIVKHIARVHGGRAEVESTPGKGSTFRIVLPSRVQPASGSQGVAPVDRLSTT